MTLESLDRTTFGVGTLFKQTTDICNEWKIHREDKYHALALFLAL